MNPLIKNQIARRVLAVGLLTASATAWAQAVNIPPLIKIVVPFTPGGSNDVYARAISEQMGKALNATVIIENKPGAGGVIGANDVAKAPADGSVLLLSSNSLVTRAAVDTKLPYDTRRSFAPVALVARGPMLLVVNKNAPYKNVAELIAATRKSPTHYGSAGIGSIGQFSAELLAKAAGIEMTHIPYKGIAGGLTDLLGDRIQMMITTSASVGSAIKADKIRALAVTSPQPSPFYPNLPTIAQTVPGYAVEVWWGLYAPGQTPTAVVNAINTAVRSAVNSEKFKSLLGAEAAEPGDMSPAQFGAFVDAELNKWSALARERKITLE